MRISFICASLENGRDGVGDYTRSLSAELIKLGNEVCIIAINDTFLQENFLVEKQIDGEKTTYILRLSSKLSWRERISKSADFLNFTNSEWISLQYVPYGYNRKGLPILLGVFLKKLGNNRKWHIMFHEIWQGESAESTLKDKLLGYFQKKIGMSLLTHLHPRWISTTNDYYKDCFFRNGIIIEKLSVFSGINVTNNKKSGALNQLPGEILKKKGNYMIGSFFGTVHVTENLIKKVFQLISMVQDVNKELIITHIGRSNNIVHLSNLFSNSGVKLFILGEWPEQDVSNFFSEIDLGISTYPKILYEKSSSISAMLNNGLPVILLRDSFEIDNRSIPEVKDITEIVNIESYINQSKDFKYSYGVKSAASYYYDRFSFA